MIHYGAAWDGGLFDNEEPRSGNAWWIVADGTPIESWRRRRSAEAALASMNRFRGSHGLPNAVLFWFYGLGFAPVATEKSP